MAQEACLTLYTCSKNTQKLVDSTKRQFEDIATTIKEEKNLIVITLFDDSTIHIHLQDDEDEILEQTNGMANYFAQAPCDNKELMKNVSIQISLFNSITGIVFTVTEEENRTNAIIGRIYAIAKDCASVILYPDMSLYTYKGELILNIDGESELDVYYPVADSDILDEQRQYNEEDQARFQAVTQVLKEKKLPVISYLMSTQLTKDSMEVASIESIAQRLCTTFACSVCAERMLMEEGSKDIGLAQFIALDQRFGCGSYLSEKERSFIEDGDAQQAIAFSWRYECVAVLLWALGLYEIDVDCKEVCRVEEMATTLRKFKNIEELIQHACIRKQDELLDFHTRILYLHHACVEARMQGIQVEDINPEIVYEYHYALNWLLNANHTRNWDAIACNT